MVTQVPLDVDLGAASMAEVARVALESWHKVREPLHPRVPVLGYPAVLMTSVKNKPQVFRVLLARFPPKYLIKWIPTIMSRQGYVNFAVVPLV